MDIISRAFKKAIKAGAKAALSVEEHGNDSITKQRMETCDSCPNFQADSQQCGVCGCFMDVKTTLLRNRNPYAGGRVEITHCPEGRWGDLEIANHYRELDGKPPLEKTGRREAHFKDNTTTYSK
ncbi:MAG: hypothetical protein KDD10_19090 [Phaeodactylibacter sp.]|nr:hypothetical protein [Phaeodactylibacter sp.]